MAIFQCIGLITTFISPEPNVKKNIIHNSNEKFKLFVTFCIALLGLVTVYTNFPNFFFKDVFLNYLYALLKISLSLAFSIFVFWLISRLKVIRIELVKDTFLLPFSQFIKTYGKITIILILLIGCYRISDIVMGVVANLFYSDMGYSLKEIATYSKFWGLISTICGGLIGGILSIKFGVKITLLIGAILASSTNLLFAYISSIEINNVALALVITADNLSAGLASTAFVAFLGNLTDTRYTAAQFAFLTSIMLIFPKLISGYSGMIVDAFGYYNFFLITSILGIPAIILNIILIRVALK